MSVKEMDLKSAGKSEKRIKMRNVLIMNMQMMTTRKTGMFRFSCCRSMERA